MQIRYTYFRSDKGKPTVVYDIKVIKQVLADEICHRLLFLYAFTGCDFTSSIFELGKKSALYKFKEDSILKTYARVFSAPNQDPVVIESTGYKVMIALFNAKPGDSLRELRYTILCKKLSAKASLHPKDCHLQPPPRISLSEVLFPGDDVDEHG